MVKDIIEVRKLQSGFWRIEYTKEGQKGLYYYYAYNNAPDELGALQKLFRDEKQNDQ